MIHPQSKYWLSFSITVLIVAAGWIWRSAVPPGSTNEGLIPAPQEGFSAPDFNLKTLDGQSIQLSDLRGQAVMINLWASWCTPCRAEMPAIERVYQDYREEGLIVLAVNSTIQDSASAAQTFAYEHRLTFPILLDMDGKVSDLYQLRALPTTFFVDKEGVIQEVVIGGPMAEALLRVRVEDLLAEVP